MKLTISIPVYLKEALHVDFTDQTLNSIPDIDKYNILIINNYCAPPFLSYLDDLSKRPNFSVIKNKTNSVSSAWNLGIKTGLKSKSDFVLTVNNDILFHPKSLDNLLQFAADHPDFLLWTGTEWSNLRTFTKAKWDGSFSLHPHFSMFMVNQHTIDTVGWFDEKLGVAYFEDNDFHIRILLSGHQAAATTTSKFYHYGSRTANIDEEIMNTVKKHYTKNREYMIKKWGIDLHTNSGYSPPEEILKDIFDHPFNDPKKSFKEW